MRQDGEEETRDGARKRTRGGDPQARASTGDIWMLDVRSEALQGGEGLCSAVCLLRRQCGLMSAGGGVMSTLVDLRHVADSSGANQNVVASGVYMRRDKATKLPCGGVEGCGRWAVVQSTARVGLDSFVGSCGEM